MHQSENLRDLLGCDAMYSATWLSMLPPSLLYMKMEVGDSSQALVSSLQTMLCHIPEDHSLCIHLHENV